MDEKEPLTWQEKLVKFAKSAGIVAAAAVATYALEWARGEDFGAYTPIVMGALAWVTASLKTLAGK